MKITSTTTARDTMDGQPYNTVLIRLTADGLAAEFNAIDAGAYGYSAEAPITAGEMIFGHSLQELGAAYLADLA